MYIVRPKDGTPDAMARLMQDACCQLGVTLLCSTAKDAAVASIYAVFLVGGEWQSTEVVDAESVSPVEKRSVHNGVIRSR